MVGLTTETVSRIIAELRRQGLQDRGVNLHECNREQLRRTSTVRYADGWVQSSPSPLHIIPA